MSLYKEGFNVGFLRKINLIPENILVALKAKAKRMARLPRYRKRIDAIVENNPVPWQSYDDALEGARNSAANEIVERQAKDWLSKRINPNGFTNNPGDDIEALIRAGEVRAPKTKILI